MKGFEQTGELLRQLTDVGQPRIARMKEGAWHANVDFPAPEGVTAKVASDFDHPTPDEALQCCIDRLGGLRDMISVPSPQPRVLRAIDG